VIEGTDVETLSPSTVWKEYEFRGKPGELAHRPPQVAPYHMRLDWLMWFAAMSNASDYPWFSSLMVQLLEGDRAVLGLLRRNPFPDRPPRWIRAQLYLYHFTSPEEHRRTGAWWTRTPAAPYFPEVRLKQ
jgi:Lipase maturation factor